MQYFSLELRTSKTHRQFFGQPTKRGQATRQPREAAPQTRGPASHPTHITAYQVAIYVNIACVFAFFTKQCGHAEGFLR